MKSFSYKMNVVVNLPLRHLYSTSEYSSVLPCHSLDLGPDGLLSVPDWNLPYLLASASEICRSSRAGSESFAGLHGSSRIEC
jgi:hypothetical protein